MATDNILEVGALVNLAGFTPGLNEMVTSTEAATTSMAGGFEKVATTTKESTDSMMFDWKELALQVRESGLRIVETTSEVGAKISETAERSRLGIGTMEAGFSGLAGILGAGIAVGFFADFLDETSRVLIELGHLNITTQISVETLSGLRNVAQQNAIPFEQLQVALGRMQRAQVQALEGNKAYRQAFKDLGISVDDLRNLKPEDLFFRLADAISHTTAPQIAMSSGITIMGRGVQTLVPLLEKYGGNLRQVTEEAAKNSGVTEEAVKAAEEWHAQTAKLSQIFQAGMVPVLQTIVSVLPKLIELLDALGAAVIAISEIVGTAVVAMARFYKVLWDLNTLQFSKLREDWRQTVDAVISGAKDVDANTRAMSHDLNNVFGKAPPTTWFDRASQMMKDLGLNAPKFDLSGVTDQTKSKTSIVQEFRAQLDQLRDAEKGYHELSKSDEAAFWQSKLALVKGNIPAMREVYHEMVAAERAARHQSLSEEMGEFAQRTAATRAGSRERLIVIEEELNYLKRIGAAETSEYRRVQDEMVVATREAAANEQKEYVKGVEGQLAAAKQNAQQKMAILNQAMWFALNTYGLDSDAYKQFAEQKIEIDRQITDQQRSIKAIDIDAEAAHARALLEIQKAAAEGEESTNKAGKRRKLEDDKSFAQQEMDIERQLLQQKLALYKDDPVEYERIQKQLLAITDKYAVQMANDTKKQQQSLMAGYDKLNAQIENGFARAVGTMVETGKGFGKAMVQLWNSLVVQFVESLAKMAAQFILHELLKLVVVQASQTAQTAATAAGAASRQGIGIAEDVKSIGRAAAVGAAHAFKWVMEEVPFPVNVALAPAAAAATFAGILAFASLAGSAAKGGVMAEDGPVFLHAREMVLPSKISAGLQNVISAGGFNVPAALNQNFSQISGQRPSTPNVVNHRSTHISPKINVQVSGNAQGMKDMSDQVVKTLKRAMRNGSLSGVEGY